MTTRKVATNAKGNGAVARQRSPTKRPVKPVGVAYMSPVDLRARLEQVYPEHYWRIVLASATGKSYAAICRYANGETPIPKWLVLVVNLLTNRDTQVRRAIENASVNAPDHLTKRIIRA